jgi:hypothetical protein
MLIPGEDVIDLDLLKRKDIKNFIGGRKVLNMEVSYPQIDGTIIVDLDFTYR